MRRAARAGVLLCAFTSLLVTACGEDEPAGPAPARSTDLAGEPALARGGLPGRPAGKVLGTVEAASPWGVAVRDDGLAYFTQLFANNVGITTTRTRTVADFVPTGSTPTGVVFSPDGNTAYVGNQDATVTVIDVGTQQVRATWSTEGTPVFALQVSPEGAILFAGGGTETLYALDTGTGEILNRVTVGHAINGFAVAPDNRTLYVSGVFGGAVSEVDMAARTVRRTFAVGGLPQGIALDRRGTRLFVANESGYLNDIDLRTGDIGTTIPLAGGGFGIGVTPDDNQAYITIPFLGTVQLFSLQQRRLIGSIDVGGDPRRVAFSRAGRLGAITNAAGYLTFIR